VPSPKRLAGPGGVVLACGPGSSAVVSGGGAVRRYPPMGNTTATSDAAFGQRLDNSSPLPPITRLSFHESAIRRHTHRTHNVRVSDQDKQGGHHGVSR
jgi:hypothetical protein